MAKTLTEIQTMVDQLVKMGEDPDEFSFWLSVYETLPQDLQEELSQNLEGELTDLSATFTPKSTPQTSV